MDELLTQIREFAEAKGGLRELSETEARQLQQAIAAACLKDPSANWWWDALAVRSAVIPYGDRDALEMLRAICREQDDVTVNLLVTDDAPPPWPAFAGTLASMCELIAEQRFFEYCLVGPGLAWLIFDTHHNELVVTGTLVERAATIIGGTRT